MGEALDVEVGHQHERAIPTVENTRLHRRPASTEWGVKKKRAQGHRRRRETGIVEGEEVTGRSTRRLAKAKAAERRVKGGADERHESEPPLDNQSTCLRH